MPSWMSGFLGRGHGAAPRAASSMDDWPPRPAERVSGVRERAPAPTCAPARGSGGFAEGVARFSAADAHDPSARGARARDAEPNALDRGLADLDARLPRRAWRHARRASPARAIAPTTA